MEKLKILRKQCNYTQKDLAYMLGVTTKDVQNWELNKAQPELKIIRDLAIIFGTSVYDILSDESIATTDYSPWNFNETIDYFWGHIGILLYNSNIIKWYPITNSTFDRVETILSNDEPSKENNILSFDTLNNRLLLINKNIVKKISLLDDASDMPKDWEIPWDGYQGLGSEEFYNLIDEYFFDYEHIEIQRIKIHNRKKILQELDLININESKVFPDIESSARYISYKNSSII
ncbi:helix-turn-helix transcriptional regulator [Frischella sp. Ac13]|uniref:Helix-turn-helix transcriptional regulator n=1 Tax=Frischella japonica TaxID=2741544 RepID=A0ABR7QWP3_9GAMM|nr:helix-turn-helix transcriptional regulator [Frischella japonica]MBC9130471.1 helix-turn-helix transcriptional regulator [Frischella japonica]